jgi:hypothetical protein
MLSLFGDRVSHAERRAEERKKERQNKYTEAITRAGYLVTI